MTPHRWSPQQLKGFAEAAQSLKLYRRAELLNDVGDKPIIQALYVDPLPDKQVLTTILRPNTTFVVGRKGTGKSTIFQRAQHAIRQQKHATSAYIDIKTIYEQSEVDPALLSALDSTATANPSAYLRKLLLFKSFALHILSEIRQELDRQIENTLLKRALKSVMPSSKELLEGLEKLLTSVDEATFIDASIDKTVTTRNTTRDNSEEILHGSVEANFSNVTARASAGAKFIDANSAGIEQEYTETLFRIFDLKQLITELRSLLARLNIHRLYPFVDDFSELPQDAMKFVVDTLIGPLNNWSEELVKFKIAAYPGRIYFGPIDRTKIDEIYLDIYKLYGHSDVPSMETKAIEFTKRLVDERVRHYSKCAPGIFLEEDSTVIWRSLFYATMANPRNLGNVLHNIHQFYLIYGKPVNTRAIADASQRYYEERVESYFALAKLSHESFDEKSSVFSLKELLEEFVTRA